MYLHKTIHYKGNNNNVINRFAAKMIKFIGKPILIKSTKRYPPGPYTIICVGEPIGVAKLEETATIKATQKVSGFAPNVIAV